jgi:hypothetical protein
MVYDLIRYEQTDTGFFVRERPPELVKCWGWIVATFYNPILNPSSLVLPRETNEHRGLKIRFQHDPAGLDYKPRDKSIVVEDTSDLGHLVQVSGLDRQSTWSDLVQKDVFLYLSKSEPDVLCGVTFDYSEEERRRMKVEMAKTGR